MGPMYMDQRAWMARHWLVGHFPVCWTGRVLVLLRHALPWGN